MLQTLSKLDAQALADIVEEKRIRQTDEMFILFTMGSQFDHLIKMGLARLGVFCVVADPSRITASDVKKLAPVGIIVSGGPASVASEPPPFDHKIFDLGIPVLGICLGFQMWAKHIGARVEPSDRREFGVHPLMVGKQPAQSWLLHDVPQVSSVLQSHGDVIHSNRKLKILAYTDDAPVAAASYRHLYGVQFHPEVSDTEHGELILSNFCFGVCSAKDEFPAGDVASGKVMDLRQRIGNGRVILALSGGSDSSVVAYLLRDAINDPANKVRGVYIRGVDRPDDEQYVRKYFGSLPWLDLKIVDGTSRFVRALRGLVSMKAKRRAIRRVYKEILEREIQRWGADFISQGTLYTDNVESGHGYKTGARRAQIKLHHNANLKFSVPELTPLDDQVKDTARNIGRILQVPEELLSRHPFPGPGLTVRIEGKITRKKLAIARACDGIFIAELRRWRLYDGVWQAGVQVLESYTTCTKGDDQASGRIVNLRAVSSIDGFTARWTELPNDFLRHVSRRITNEIREVGAVSLSISDKPPTTIELG